MYLVVKQSYCTGIKGVLYKISFKAFIEFLNKTINEKLS